MKFRIERTAADQFDEDHEAEGLRDALTSKGLREASSPSETYWANLLVRTNQRIDAVTSPRALSISWAARVAIPGVVAIISFLVGLHYYVPETVREQQVFDFSALPLETLDSLYTAASGKYSPIEEEGAVFDMSLEQITDYVIDNDRAEALLVSLSDQQMEVLMRSLDGSRQF